MRERQRSAGSAAIASYFPVALERVATALVNFVLGCVTAGIGVFSSDPHALRLQVPRPVYWVVGAAACWFAAFASRRGRFATGRSHPVACHFAEEKEVIVPT